MTRGVDAASSARGQALKSLGPIGVHPRDLPPLCDLVRFSVMAENQLARRYADSTFAATRLLQLEEAGVVQRWDGLLEDTRVYVPTRLARLAARVADVRPRKPSIHQLAHDIAVVDLADVLVAQHPAACWIAEAQVRSFLNRIAPPARRLRGDRRHPPDGLLVVGSERIGIELEHSDKGRGRYTQISGWFIRELRVDRVRWYIDNPRILERMRRLNAEHGFDRDMQIELLEFPPGVRLRQRPNPFKS